MDEQIWYIFMEWADNPFICEEEIEHLSKTMSKEELQSRRYGQFRSNAGLVYSEFDERVHVVEPFAVPIEWYDKISIDPGLNNPLSVHFYAVDFDGNVYVIAEHYEAGKDVVYHSQRILDIAKRLNWPCDRNGNIEALIDSAANQTTLANSKSVSQLFGENKILVNTRVNKDVFSGINRIKGYLKSASGGARLFVFKTCVNMIFEFKTYFWGSADTPKKQNDHALDELRYYIMSRPTIPSPNINKSIIAKDKERLAKKVWKQNL